MDEHFFTLVRNLRFRELKTRTKAQLAVVRQSRRGGSASCDCRVSCPPWYPAGSFAARWSCGRRAQPGDAHQIISGAHQVGRQLGEFAAPITGAAEVGDGLYPAEDLLHPLALLLADNVARVPQRSSIQRRAAPAAVIGS